ncbi:hypothetical protein HYDPIDRAFT_92003 [Hydnomerulius pinastri MD-312]|uniref:RNA exonuclease 4 n=1 Tax=Hydnomerulius pinastri MD-312 TaxID=994086 RepID=A0A0C9WEN6_9AGAM|nr:hypothetical protein HYDPIDRAFT_92003 [Hydnomerulius pinastri MD-312]
MSLLVARVKFGVKHIPDARTVGYRIATFTLKSYQRQRQPYFLNVNNLPTQCQKHPLLKSKERFSFIFTFISSDRLSTTPSSNWLALQKVLHPPGSKKPHPPRKRRKLNHDDEPTTITTPPPEPTAFPRASSFRAQNHNAYEEVDLDTTEVKNRESIAALRKMVLGKVEYRPEQTTPGKYLALDCEMVGVGLDGEESSLARVSIVNYSGAVVLDVFVRQRERVVDYRTQWSGVRSGDLGGGATPFEEVQKTVAELIKDRILVGHAVHNDLKALLLSHPSPQTRDTQSLAHKHRVSKSRRPALRVLVRQELGVGIQGGEHSSITDARATMALFRLHKKQWESGFKPPLAHGGGKQKRKRGAEAEDARAGDEGDEESSQPHPSSSPRPPKQSGPRKGVSSGLSTVLKRAGTRSSGEAGGAGGKWWTSLGGKGPKGSIRV